VNPVRPRGTKIGTGVHLDTKHKPVKAFLKFRKIDLFEVNNVTRNQRFFDSTVRKVDSIRPRGTQIGTGMHLDTGHKGVFEVSKKNTLPGDVKGQDVT